MKEYKIIESKNNIRPYAIFTNCGVFGNKCLSGTFTKATPLEN